MGHRREHIETVLEDMNACPGSVIDLKGAVITCSLRQAAGTTKLELSASGSVLKNGTLRLPHGCTVVVKPADGICLEDITLQMLESVRNSDKDRQIVAAEDGLCHALLHIEPDAGLTVTRCRVSGCCGVGVYVDDGAKLCGSDLWLEHCSNHAMEVAGGHVDLAGCSVKDSGGGVLCSSHACVTIQHLSAQGIKSQLVSAVDGAEVHLQKAKLEGGDVAVTVEGRAQLQCQGVTILGGSGSAGVRLMGSGTTAKFEACHLQRQERAALYVGGGAELLMASCMLSEYGCNTAPRGKVLSCYMHVRLSESAVQLWSCGVIENQPVRHCMLMAPACRGCCSASAWC